MTATIVLPDPTSPCRRRFIGTGRARSDRISVQTRCCAAVRAKGKSAQEPLDERTRGARGAPLLARLPPPPERQADLQHEEVLEGEPAAGRLHVLEPLREVDGPVRRGHRQEISPPAQLVGQDVGSLVRRRW